VSVTEILFRIVNNGTYHRGFVSGLMSQVPLKEALAVALERADYLNTEDFDYLTDCYAFDPMVGGRPLTVEIIS
jgi:hypothetical protein